MILLRSLLLGGLRHDAGGNPISAADDIKSLLLIDDRVALQLNDCSLYAELTAPADSPEAHSFTVALEGPEGSVTLFEGEISFGPPANDVRAASMTMRLDGQAIRTPGRHTFCLRSSGAEVGTHPIDARVAQGRARARFGAFLQDEQGVEGDRRYLRARMPFTLHGADGAFGGYHVITVVQPEGRNFETDPLRIEVPPGYDRLKQAYDFTVAVHRAYDSYAQGLFGGHLPDGANVRMSNNVVLAPTDLEFDLPQDTSSGGW